MEVRRYFEDKLLSIMIQFTADTTSTATLSGFQVWLGTLEGNPTIKQICGLFTDEQLESIWKRRFDLVFSHKVLIEIEKEVESVLEFLVWHHIHTVEN